MPLMLGVLALFSLCIRHNVIRVDFYALRRTTPDIVEWIALIILAEILKSLIV